jgi:hypothetical protein
MVKRVFKSGKLQRLQQGTIFKEFAVVGVLDLVHVLVGAQVILEIKIISSEGI